MSKFDVDRLRRNSYDDRVYDGLIEDAADEIEALRDKIIEQGRHAASLQHHLTSAEKQLIEIAQFLGRDASAEGVSSIAEVVRQDVEELRSKINHSGVVKRKINREVLKELHEMRGNPDEHYIPPVTLAKRAVKAEAEIERLREEADWIRDKLKLPRDAKLFTGEKCVAGRLHVTCARADGYERYIEAYKCNDKDGEIARQSVEIERLRSELLALIRLFPKTADEGPHDAESCYFTREAAEAARVEAKT